jgi:hypothetical protein
VLHKWHFVYCVHIMSTEWKVHHVGFITLTYCDARSAELYTDILWCTVSRTVYWYTVMHSQQNCNPLPLLFKSLLPGQEACVFFSGHLNLHAKPETGIPYREKNYNN